MDYGSFKCIVHATQHWLINVFNRVLLEIFRTYLKSVLFENLNYVFIFKELKAEHLKQKPIPKFDTSNYRNTSMFNYDDILEDDSDEDNDILDNDSDA